jgi:hypothetical protein
MSTYTAKDYFVDWYRTIPALVDEEIKTKRISAIEELVEIDDVDFWLDITRMSFKLNPEKSENREKFVKAFRDADLTFPLLKNDNLVHVLAAISICIKLEEDESIVNDIIANAILNAPFFKQFKKGTKVPLSDYARRYLNNSGDRKIMIDAVREMQDVEGVKKIENKLTAGDKWLPEDYLSLTKAVNVLGKSNQLLQEEVNVLWWLVGEYSKTCDKTFVKVGIRKMIAIAPIELAELTILNQGFVASKALLKRILLLSNKGNDSISNFSFMEVLKAMSKEVVQYFAELENISELTPCLYIIQKSIDSDMDGKWVEEIKQKTSIDLNMAKEAADISQQLYEELMYLKLY